MSAEARGASNSATSPACDWKYSCTRRAAAEQLLLVGPAELRGDSQPDQHHGQPEHDELDQREQAE